MTHPADLTTVVSALGDGRPACLLLLFDFDGTLAEFAPLPGVVQLPALRRELLAKLADRPYTTVGVVSGRRLDDVKTRVGLGPPLVYAGLHGMEIEGSGERFVHEDARAARPYIQLLRSEIERELEGLTGVVVEDKEYSVVVHWRLAAPPVKNAAAQALRRLTEPPRRERRIRIQPGHEMCEVLPNVRWDKGDAVLWIERMVTKRRGVRPRTLYVGDDLTDEHAFQVLASRGVTVGVGRPRPTAARYWLPDTAAVEHLLRMLAAMPLPKEEPGDPVARR